MEELIEQGQLIKKGAAPVNTEASLRRMLSAQSPSKLKDSKTGNDTPSEGGVSTEAEMIRGQKYYVVDTEQMKRFNNMSKYMTEDLLIERFMEKNNGNYREAKRQFDSLVEEGT